MRPVRVYFFSWFVLVLIARKFIWATANSRLEPSHVISVHQHPSPYSTSFWNGTFSGEGRNPLFLGNLCKHLGNIFAGKPASLLTGWDPPHLSSYPWLLSWQFLITEGQEAQERPGQTPLHTPHWLGRTSRHSLTTVQMAAGSYSTEFNNQER